MSRNKTIACIALSVGMLFVSFSSPANACPKRFKAVKMVGKAVVKTAKVAGNILLLPVKIIVPGI